tara:strand:- start:2314 stop:4008 length:1695 start_codon:yes stop_codon:yes gene_type:complete
MQYPSETPLDPIPPPPVLPFPSYLYQTGMAGELFHDIIYTYQQESKAPPTLCIQAALGIGALLQQGIVELESPSGHTTSASLILFAGLEPAAGKSSVMDRFTAPINEFIDTHTAKHQKLADEHTQEKEVWERTRKALMRDLSKAEAEVAVLLAEAETEAEEEKREEVDVELPTEAEASSEIDGTGYQATIKRVKTLKHALKTHTSKAPLPPATVGLGILSEATPAAITKFIKDNRIQSLAIISAEGEEFLNKGIKNQSSVLNKGFSGEKTSKQLATRGDESHNAPITALIFGQPYIMEKAFGGDNNRFRGTGTLSRCLFTCPFSNIGYQHRSSTDSTNYFQPNVDRPATEKSYHLWASELMDQNVKLFESGASRRRRKLSKDALAIWYQGRAELDIQLRPGGRYEQFRDHGNRLPEQWLRVALVIHGYNQRDHDEISAHTLRQAIVLVNSFSTEFQNVFRPTSQEERDTVKLLKWINDKRSQGFRYIGKSFATTGSSLRPVARLNNALQMLQQNGEINVGTVSCVDQKGRNTKPMVMLDLNPTLPFDQQAFDYAVNQARMLNNN